MPNYTAVLERANKYQAIFEICLDGLPFAKFFLFAPAFVNKPGRHITHVVLWVEKELGKNFAGYPMTTNALRRWLEANGMEDCSEEVERQLKALGWQSYVLGGKS